MYDDDDDDDHTPKKFRWHCSSCDEPVFVYAGYMTFIEYKSARPVVQSKDWESIEGDGVESYTRPVCSYCRAPMAMSSECLKEY